MELEFLKHNGRPNPPGETIFRALLVHVEGRKKSLLSNPEYPIYLSLTMARREPIRFLGEVHYREVDSLVPETGPGYRTVTGRFPFGAFCVFVPFRFFA